MAKIKISKVAKDLNVALPTVIEFLRKKNITIDDNPNARIEDDIVEILANEFRSDKDQKSKSEQLSSERQKEKAKPAPKEAPAPVEEIVLPIEPAIAPKIVGKIDINNVGKSTPKEPEKVVEEKQPKKEEPKAKEVVAETKTKESAHRIIKNFFMLFSSNVFSIQSLLLNHRDAIVQTYISGTLSLYHFRLFLSFYGKRGR